MKRTAIASVALLAMLSLAGCSAGSQSSGAYDMPAEAEYDAGSDGGALESQTDGFESQNGAVKDEEREQIVTGYMTVTVDTPAEAAKDAIRIVEGVAGRVDGRQEYAPTDGDKGSSTLTLRIPAAALDSTLEKLGDLGEVVEISTTADDVSALVKDIDARVLSLQASVNRLTALLATASDVDQLVSIESSLTSRQGELESLLAQQRSVGDAVALATITLSLISEEDAPPPAAPVTFLTGLEAGWNSFVTFISGAIVVIGVLIPWLVFFALITAIVVVIVRLRRRRAVKEESPTIAP